MVENEDAERYASLLIGHGALVAVVGLLAGFGLLFALLGEVAIWPLPGIEAQVPGSVRGWQAAHVGGLLNGVMMVAFAFCLPKLGLNGPRLRWVTWGLVYTGWANTVFYWLGNLAPNRGLSGGDNALGEGSLAGFLAYLPAATATVVTMACGLAIAAAAFRAARAGSP